MAAARTAIRKAQNLSGAWLSASPTPPSETPVLRRTYISPVESELMNKWPSEPHARPTGRKHLSGHMERSALLSMSRAALTLAAGSTGEPLLNAILLNLYPTGSARFPVLHQCCTFTERAALTTAMEGDERLRSVAHELEVKWSSVSLKS